MALLEVTALANEQGGWCIRRAVNSVGVEKTKRRKPPRTDAYIPVIARVRSTRGNPPGQGMGRGCFKVQAPESFLI